MATDTGTATGDAKSWSFTLRDGLTWQDGPGRALTSPTGLANVRD